MKPNLHKPDEKLLYHKVLDQVFLCENDHQTRFTAFMNRVFAKRFIAHLQTEFRGLKFESDGGIEDTERVKIAIMQDYAQVDKTDYPIDILEIQHNKFKEISHKDILGSVLGLGVDRAKIGDIFIYESRSVVFLDRGISDFVQTNLSYIGRAKITTSLLADNSSVFVPLDNYKVVRTQLDKVGLTEVVAKGFRCSRSESGKLMTGKKVFINWEMCSKEKTLELDDTVTVRGFGRIVIADIEEEKNGVTVQLHVYGDVKKK